MRLIETADVQQRINQFKENIEKNIQGGYSQEDMQRTVWEFVKSFNAGLPYNSAEEFWKGEVNNINWNNWSNNNWNNWSNNNWNNWANNNHGGLSLKKRDRSKNKDDAKIEETAKAEDNVKVEDTANTTDDSKKKKRSERKNRSSKA